MKCRIYINIFWIKNLQKLNNCANILNAYVRRIKNNIDRGQERGESNESRNTSKFWKSYN